MAQIQTLHALWSHGPDGSARGLSSSHRDLQYDGDRAASTLQAVRNDIPPQAHDVHALVCDVCGGNVSPSSPSEALQSLTSPFFVFSIHAMNFRSTDLGVSGPAAEMLPFSLHVLDKCRVHTPGVRRVGSSLGPLARCSLTSAHALLEHRHYKEALSAVR
jgi:hypothetical protein